MTFEEKKAFLQAKLKAINITDSKFPFLPYLDESGWVFKSPVQIAKRCYVFYSIAFLILNNQDKKDKLVVWMKQEHIWEEVAESEKLIFENPYLDGVALEEWSWVLERTCILIWVLGYHKGNLDPKEVIDFDTVAVKIPQIGEKLSTFFAKVSTIAFDKEKVFLENIFNEQITSTLRDISFGLDKPIPDCDAYVSFERHKVLNWIRNYGHTDKSKIVGWDEVGTDT